MQKLLLLFLLLQHGLAAQKISIEIFEKKSNPIIGATVKIAVRADSTQVLTFVTDQNGQIQADLKLGQQYVLEATYLGFLPLKKGLQITAQKTHYRFEMEENFQALADVTIRAKKPLMRQEEDKTIVDPEPIAQTTTSVYEVLEKTPGLFVDQDGNIYLNSATPAAIYINGREQKMSTADIASMLKSLPPNSIQRLEILRTPSAKYDAGSSGGIVNVVLKKGVKIGRIGNLQAGMTQGRYGNQNIGLSLNDQNGNRTSYLQTSVQRRDGYDQIITTRALAPDSSLKQDAFSRLPGHSYFAGYGLGYDRGDRWNLNFDGRVHVSRSHNTVETANTISQLQIPEFQTQNDLDNTGRSFSINQGISGKYMLDTLGSEITADVSYNFSKNTTAQDFRFSAILPPGSALNGGNGDFANNRHFFIAKADLKYKFPYKITLESGVKSAIQRFHSATDYYTVVDGIQNPDPFRTNTFEYREQIHAAYAQASKPLIGGFLLKAGTRLENTQMDGHQIIPGDTAFTIRRTDWFPYVYLSRRVMAVAGYELRGYLIYRRSINRPGYDNLNPFPRFLDQYLYETGNPALKPQFTSKYEFNISFDDMPIFAVGRNYITDIFTNVVYADPLRAGVAYRTYDNLGKNEETYFKITGAVPPGGVYFIVVGAQYNRNKYSGLYENEPIQFDRGSWHFFTYQQLKLGGRSTLSLNGYLRLKGQSQFYTLSDNGGLNISINRLFMKRKLTITLSASDIFYSQKNDFALDQGNITAFGTRSNDSRRVGISAQYSFGLRKKEEEKGLFNLEGMGN